MLKIQPKITTVNNDFNRLTQPKQSDFCVFSNPIKNDIFIPKNKESTLFNPSFGSKKQNRYEQGVQIAKNLKQILSKNIGAVNDTEFIKQAEKINVSNIIPTVKAYDVISPKESLISAICNEKANKGETRKIAVKNILDKLVSAGKEAGVQTEHYKTDFNTELNEQFDKIFPVKSDKLDKTFNALVQAVENKKSLTDNDKNQIKSLNPTEAQSYSVKILGSAATKAQKSLTEQGNYDGWAAKLGENVRKLWNSHNQKELVQEDIDKFKSQITDLKKSENSKEFNSNFKNIFNIDFDPELIVAYKNKEQEYISAVACSSVENSFNDLMKDLLNEQPLQDKVFTTYGAGTPIIHTIETKEEVYKRNYSAFADFVGKGNKENGAKQIKKTLKEYKIKPDSTMEEKYEVLQKMANKYSRRLHQNTERALNKKELSTISKEYESSYYAAFGVDNDIAQRVTDYRNSQMLSELLIQDGILGVATIPIWLCTAGTGLIPTLKIAGMSSALSTAVYGSDRLSSKQGMTEKDIKEIIKWAAIDGATAIANQLSYNGVSYLTSPINKMSKSAAKLIDFTLTTAADIGLDCAAEYVGTGKVTLQGVVYSVIFSHTGQIIDIKIMD